MELYKILRFAICRHCIAAGFGLFDGIRLYRRLRFLFR